MRKSRVGKLSHPNHQYLIKGSEKPRSRKDKVGTLVHRANDIAFALNHGVNHMLEAKMQAEKLDEHIKANPELKQANTELHARVRDIHQALKKTGKALTR